ncbi:MAG: uracil-DNA glycosylase [Acidiferrobacterales bacterium]
MESREARRREYLDAMGIDRWERRSPKPTLASAPVPAVVTTRDTTDISQMDWTLLQGAVQNCTKCALHKTRTQAVFGVGNRDADWLFIGEAPGAEEDRHGEPFVGRAGQLLNAMLFAVGLKREDVYIANVLKSRPPNNRDPQLEEVEACEPYLLRQIELIKPRIILALGRHAAHSLLKTDLPLGKLRGRRLSYHNTPLVATYHPAYLLRNPVDKSKSWQDLLLARSIVGGA